MKKIILSVAGLLILVCNSRAQFSENPIYDGPQFHFGFDIGLARYDGAGAGKAGLAVGLNFKRSAVELQGNLYTQPCIGGPCGGAFEGVTDLSLLYGRFWDFSRSRLQVNAGLSWLRKRESEYYSSEWHNVDMHTVGIPVDVRFYFHSGKHFAWGVKAFTNINSINTLTGAGLVFSFRD